MVSFLEKTRPTNCGLKQKFSDARLDRICSKQKLKENNREAEIAIQTKRTFQSFGFNVKDQFIIEIITISFALEKFDQRNRHFKLCTSDLTGHDLYKSPWIKQKSKAVVPVIFPNTKVSILAFRSYLIYNCNFQEKSSEFTVSLSFFFSNS